MFRVLNIDEYVLNEVKKVIAYASEHPYDENYRKLQLAGDVYPVGDNPDHVVHIHQGFRVVYSITISKGKSYHHLSISIKDKGRFPSVEQTQIIMDLFGMGDNIKKLDTVWLEEEIGAVNLLKEIK